MVKKLVTTIIIITAILFILVFLGYNYNADLTAIRSINVNLDDIILQDVKFTSFKLKFNVNFSNPTNQYISNLNSNFNIYIADNYIGKGNFSNISIPAQSKCFKDISVIIYYAGLADAAVDIIKNVINNEKFDLTIEGKIRGNALFGLTMISQNYKAIKTYS